MLDLAQMKWKKNLTQKPLNQLQGFKNETVEIWENFEQTMALIPYERLLRVKNLINLLNDTRL